MNALIGVPMRISETKTFDPDTDDELVTKQVAVKRGWKLKGTNTHEIFCVGNTDVAAINRGEVKAGNRNMSCTFLCSSWYDKGVLNESPLEEASWLTFIDAPGMPDTRGWEWEVTNAITIKETMNRCGNCRILVCMNHGELLVNPPSSFRDTVKVRGCREKAEILLGDDSCLVI